MNLLLRVIFAITNIVNPLMRGILSFFYRKRQSCIPQITDSLFKMSATRLAGMIRKGEITSYELVNAYIERIKLVNPLINAVIDDRFEAALNEARTCDEQIQAGKFDAVKLEKEKPLYGVPISVKECCPVKGLSYTGCTLSCKGKKAVTDAVVVRLFRDAGAIPLCVTNTPEKCGNFDSTNPVHGRTHNPYDSRYTPGGSSGGEGALLAAGASLIGIGSDLAGSIRVPALFNGIFGHKPSPKVVPSLEHLPPAETDLARECLTFGPMTRYAEDLGIAMRIMTATCERDLRLDAPVDLKRLRVYYLTGYEKSFGILPVMPEIEESILKAAKYFEQRGVATEKLPIEWPATIVEMELAMFLSLKDGYQIFPNKDPEVRKNLLLEMGKAFLGLSEHTKAPLLFAIMLERHPCFNEAQLSLYKKQGEEIRQKLVDLLGDDGVLMYPTFRAPTTFPDIILGELGTSLPYSILPNVFQIPSTQVPMGLNRDGLPVGFQVLAAPYQDRLCLKVARELETAFGGWVPPSRSIRD